MNVNSQILSVILLSAVAYTVSADDVVIQNDEMSLTIGADGLVKSLVHRPTGEECI